MATRGKSELTLAYMAGLFDGEGYVTIQTDSSHKSQKNSIHVLVAGINITHQPTVVMMKEAWRGTVSLDPREYPNRKRCYMWKVSGPMASAFLKDVYPYLKIKKPQAKIGMEFQVLKTHRWGRAGIPMDNLRKRDDLTEEIRTHNASRFPRPQRLSERAPV